MKDRLQQFLEVEQLSPARLADIMGIQRSGLSHILSGRNKPGFDFIQKMLLRFPTLNSEWLITGKGKMYKDLQNRALLEKQTTNQILPTDSSELLSTDKEDYKDVSNYSELSEDLINGRTQEIANEKKTIKRILLIYSDNTFQEIRPAKVVL